MRLFKIYARFFWLYTLSMFLPTAVFTERLEKLQAELRAAEAGK